MIFLQWFQLNGDKLFTFITLASVALQNVDGLPAWASKLILIGGILATAAHQSFFGNSQPTQSAQPKVTP